MHAKKRLHPTAGRSAADAGPQDTGPESVMKVRIRFYKTGALVYIGHLDVMRYFQKLFVRAGISVAYSEGFSPHQLLSFTPPLPLGMESEGEYADVVLAKSISSDEALKRLRDESVPEIYISSFKELDDRSENAMAAVSAASYSVKFENIPENEVKEKVDDLLSKECSEVLKKTKKSEKNINIRPLIYDLSYDNGALYMLISSGSVDNIKPELVINAMFADSGRTFTPQDLLIKRLDQFTTGPEGLISLDLIGKNTDG